MMISWLRNGVLSLGIAGLYAVMIALLRTPYVNKLFNASELFKPALVIHVNLSVLAWMLCILFVVWVSGGMRFFAGFVYSACYKIAIILMAISPYTQERNAFMNNYIPMFENIWFILALSIIGAVTLCAAIEVIWHSCIISIISKNKSHNYGDRIAHTASLSGAIMVIATWGCFGASYMQLQKLQELVPLDIEYYYEMLFWSGGHLLQFLYTQLFMCALVALAERCKRSSLEYHNVYEFLLWLNCLFSLLIFWGHVKWNIFDGNFKEFFTQHMIYTGGIASILTIALLTTELLIARVWRANTAENVRHDSGLFVALYCTSVFLFLSGGLIGVCISGVNVTIPAHYHGSIVGISLGLMAFVYLSYHPAMSEDEVICNKFNLIDDFSCKDQALAKKQVYILFAGQCLHIIGLAAAGGYGVMRKSPGQELPFAAKFYMGLVGLGGMLAIIGGMIFVYLAMKKLYKKLDY